MITPRRYYKSKPDGFPRINRSHPLAPDVGYFLANESGDIVNSLDNARYTLQSGVSHTVGPKGRTLAFDGTTSAYINLFTYNITTPFTAIMCWSQDTAAAKDDAFWGADESGGDWIQCWSDDNGATSRFGFGTAAPVQVDYSTVTTVSDQIYNVAITSDGTNYRGYHDGIAWGSGISASLTSADYQVRIGATDATNVKNLTGKIYWFYFTSKQLSANQVFSIYQDPYQFIEQPTQKIYPYVAPAVGGRINSMAYHGGLAGAGGIAGVGGGLVG